MKTSTKTLLALSLAAAFGGFAATAIREGLRTPAQAAPLPAITAGGVQQQKRDALAGFFKIQPMRPI